MVKATPFLMFQGQAQGALALYRETFPDYPSERKALVPFVV